MRFRGFRPIMLAVACLSFCAVGWSDDAPAPLGTRYRLVYKFKAGQVINYEVSHQMRIDTQIPNGGEETVRNKSDTKRHYTVKSVGADGSAQLETVIDWVRMTATFSEKEAEIEFQSDDETKHHPKFRHIMDSVGKPLADVHMSNLGKVIKVTANQAVVAGKGGTDTASPEMFLTELPEIPVAVGEVWKERFDVQIVNADKLKQNIPMLRTYKLTDIKGSLAKIEFRTAILAPVNDPAIEVQLCQRETVGTIEFDMQQGMVLSKQVSVDRTVANAINGGGTFTAHSSYTERVVPVAVADAPAGVRK